MEVELTGCCALVQLRANNDTSEQEIKKFISFLKKNDDKDKNWYKTPNTGLGATSTFCIVTLPYEKELEEKLIKLNFKKTNTFKRRNGYGYGHNVMYVYNL